MRCQSTDSPTLPVGCGSNAQGELKTEEPGKTQPQQATKITWIILALILLITAGLRVRVLDMSFERDEGEYAYIAQLILQGEVPFTRAYTMKYPGVPYVYALFLAVFGQTDVAIHLGLLIINAVSIVLVFLLGKRLFNPLIGLIAAGCFAFLSLSRSTLGFTANAEHFVDLPMLVATLLLLRAVEKQRRGCLLGSGFLFGVAVLMKQHAAAFAAFGIVYLLLQNLVGDNRSLKRLFLQLCFFSISVIIPVALLWFYLWIEGAFSSFWFWTFAYPRYYVSMASLGAGKSNLMSIGGFQVVNSLGIYSLALVGVAAALRSCSSRPPALFLLLFTGFSFLGVCPGLLFRTHYFLLLVPAASLLAGVGAVALGQLCRNLSSPNRIAVLMALLALLSGFAKQFPFFFLFSSLEIQFMTYPTRFHVIKEMGLYIKDHSSPEDRMAVLGSEPQMYFYARRPAATNYIYMYPLTEPNPYALPMQEDMMAQIERAQPRYIVIVRSNDSWFSFLDPNLPQPIRTQWPRTYVATHYRRVLVADSISLTHTDYFWGQDAVSYQPRSENFVILYERLPTP